MTVLLAVDEALDGHDAAMNEARPDREPDQARVRRRAPRREDEKHPECGVDADDHHQIVGGNERTRSRLSPHPARGPDDAERVDTEDEDQPDQDKHHTKSTKATRVRHGPCLLSELDPTAHPARGSDRPSEASRGWISRRSSRRSAR